MGTHINLGGDTSEGNGSNNSNQSKPLARQSSLYSLTFDELQTTLGEPGKDFGSINMDELLKNIWTAEEPQTIMTTSSAVAAAGPSGFVPGGNVFQRQGSLTLPRTLCQKTVDEVWKSLVSKEGSIGNSDAPEMQQALGGITLEDFLLRAGVVKEENNCAQTNENCSSGFYANNGATGLGFGFGQPNQDNIEFNSNNNSMGGTMQQQPHQRMPPTILPRQANIKFTAPVNMGNRSLFEAGVDGPVNSNSTMGRTGVTLAATSPRTSNAENNTWSSPVPYVFSRGRRSNPDQEKVVERRQKRMIKNRESAARSRARKQAYTLELEAEIESLKQTNQDLQRKQAETMKTQTQNNEAEIMKTQTQNNEAEIMKTQTQNNELKESSKQRPWLAKTQCLRRTLTGPW